MGVSERLWWTGSETCRTDEDGGTRIKLQIRDAPRASWEESGYSRHTRLQKWFQCFLLFFSEQMLWTLHTCWVVLFLLSTTQTEPWLSSQVSKVKALSRLWMYFTLLYFSVCYITSWTYSDVLTENTTHFSILTQKTAKYINIIQHLFVHCQTLSVWSTL